MKKLFFILTILFTVSLGFTFSQIPENDTLMQGSNYEEISNFDTNFKIESQRLQKNIFLIAFIFMTLVVAMILFIYHSKIKEVIKLVKIQERELELKKFEVAKLSMILNYTENSILISDKSGEILWANNGYTSLFGKSYQEMKIKNKTNIFIDLNDKNSKIVEAAKLKKEPVLISCDFTDEFGSKIWYQRHIIPIVDENKEIINYAAVDADLTAIKLAMEQVNIQKKKVEEQKEKITDSINYASYIQTAVLPPTDLINEILPDHFILYMPRDIVSGDFYWTRKIDNSIFIVAADCTGHGVPGGFMSMLGISFLNEIIRTSEIKANEVLNKLRDKIINALHQTGKEGEQKDGMDISICIINENNNKMQYAGANNPVYIISEVGGKKELNVIKADKMPIGIHSRSSKSFENNEVELHKGDEFYMSSDGYSDQFGGPDCRKFLQKNFKDLLFENYDKSMEEQKTILHKTILKWMSFKDSSGNKHEQLDDILVMGIKY